MEDIGLSVEVTTFNGPRDVPEPTGVKCTLCGKSFSDNSNCRKHFLRHNQKKGNECEICHHLFQGRQQKLQHMMFEHGVEMYEFKCTVCGLIFNKLEDLQKHSVDKHDSGEQCKICWLLFKSKEEYQAHMDNHVETNTAQLCKVCGKYYRDKFSLKLHMRSHTGEKPFDCPNCPEKFTARMYLFRHVEQKHVKDTPYHCELCDVSFKTIIQLRSHVRIKMHLKNQSNDPKPEKVQLPKVFKCPNCPKSFAKQTYLTVHMKIHSEVKPYHCPICSKGFAQVCNMNSHIQSVHQPKVSKPGEEKIFACPECQNTFNNIRAFKYHMRSHKKSKLFICKFCGKQLNNVDKLRLHEGSHNPDSKIKCSACLKVFFSWGNLTRHKKTCKVRKKMGVNLKQEVAYTDQSETHGEIDEAELSETVSKIIKSEPVWDNQADVQVGNSVLTIKSRSKRKPRHDFKLNYPSKNLRKNTTATANKPATVSSDHVTKSGFGNGQDSAEHAKNFVHDDHVPEQKVNKDRSLQNPSKNNQLQRIVFQDTGDHVVPIEESMKLSDQECPQERSDLPIFVNSSSGMEADTRVPSSQKVACSTQSERPKPEKDMKLGTQSMPSNPEPSINTILPHDSSLGDLSNELQEVVPESEKEATITDMPSDELVQLMSHDYKEPSFNSPSPQKTFEIITKNPQATASKTNQVFEIISEDGTTHLNPQLPISQASSIKEQQTQRAAQSVVDILSIMEDADSKLDPEVKPQVIQINEFTQGLTDPSSKKTSMLFKVNDQLVEFQYFYPDPVAEEEISTSKHASQDLEDVVSSASNVTQDVMDIISPSNELIEIKDFDRSQDNIQNGLSITDKPNISRRSHSNLVKVKEFACSLCHKQFSDKSNLQHHIKRHNQNKGNECDICRQLFQGKQQVFQHKMSVHNIKPTNLTCDICGILKGGIDELRTHSREAHSFDYPYECGYCFKRYKDEEAYENHVTFHVKPFPCNLCNKTFNSAKQLGLHYRSHTGERPYECKVCHKTFIILSHLKTHQFTHVEKKPFSCEICQKGFINFKRLQDHIKTHEKVPKVSTHCKTRKKSAKHSGRIFPCTLCDKTFKEKTYLTIHMRVHSGEKPYKCPVCGKTFSQNGNMLKHWKVHDKPKVSDWLKCDTCDMQFRSKSEFKRHQKLSHKTKRYTKSSSEFSRKCTICDKVLRSENSYSKHMYYHNSVPFECQICHTWLSCEATLKKHLEELHDPNHQFVCKTCDRRYEKQETLLVHMKTHADKTLQCSECDKLFSNQKALKNHMSVHNDLCEHECQLCSNRYNSKGNLVRHLKTHNDNENVSPAPSSPKKIQIRIASDCYKCVDCERVFEDRSNFLEHVQSHTAVDYIKQ